jgi:branched-chain amino acid transport system substrate-binding protein
MKASIIAGALIAAATVVGTAIPAAAQDSVYVPLFTYRTGPFSGSGIFIAEGMHDYLEMLNQRDGGIGGVKIAIEECETGYDTKKGLECYEQVKGKNPVIVNPWSTGITLPLIPRAAVDKIPVLSMAYGLSASAIGDTFPWIFNPPDTYWDGLSMILRYIGSREGGLDKLKGKTPVSAASRSRCSSSSPRITASRSSSIRWQRPRCRTSRRSGSTCAAISPITW